MVIAISDHRAFTHIRPRLLLLSSTQSWRQGRVGGPDGATPQTCWTQLASCRGTVWLSCLPLFRGEDKAVSEGRLPGKQRYPFILTHTHSTNKPTPRWAPSCLAHPKPTVQPSKLSCDWPAPLLSWCRAHVTFTVWWQWAGMALPAN